MDEKTTPKTEQTTTTESTGLAVAEEKNIASTSFDPKNAFDPTTLNALWKLANIYSGAGIVPQSYRNKPNDCFVAVSIAARLGIDPMIVMQSSDVISGNFSWRGQACIALIQASNKYIDLHYIEDYKNRTNFSCKLVGTSKETGRVYESETIDYEMVKAMGWADKTGSYWNKMPRQMARYRSAAYFARAFCPEVLMGLYTTDEQADINKLYEEDLDNE